MPNLSSRTIATSMSSDGWFYGADNTFSSEFRITRDDIFGQDLTPSSNATFTGLKLIDSLDTASAVYVVSSSDGGLTSTLDTSDANFTFIPNGTGHFDINEPPSSEKTGISVAGTTYDSAFRVNDIGSTSPAQIIIHRHSQSLQAVLLGTRSNSNSDAHISVTNSMNLFSIIGCGWTSSTYGIFGEILFSSDASGTIGATSNPGAIRIRVTKNGNIVPTTAITIRENGNTGVSNDSPLSKFEVGASFATKGLTKTSDYTADETDSIIYADASLGSVQITLPSASSSLNRHYYIKKIDSSANNVTITPNGTDLIDGSSTASLSSQYDSIHIHAQAVEWYIL